MMKFLAVAHVALVFSVVPLSAQQTTVPQPRDATTWPIPGVLALGKEGVTSPQLIKQAKPNYTAAAMRAKIQGVVVLECVVEQDGSVGPVRVTRSLDEVFGLDDEAIRTVKQWRFVPGTKEGLPVRVAVTVELSFTLRSSPDSRIDAPTPGPLGWPDTFITASEPSLSIPAGWSEDSVATQAVEVRYAYPPSWSIRKGDPSQYLTMLHADDANGNRTITISYRDGAPLSLTTPLPEAALKSFLSGVGQMPGTPAGAQMVKSGQVGRAGGLWLWLEMVAPTVDFPNAPPEIAEHLRTAHNGMHMWAFTTTARGQNFSVFCSVLHAANASDADKEAETRRAGPEFAAVLKRILFYER